MFENQNFIPFSGYLLYFIPRHACRGFAIILSAQACLLYDVIFCHIFQLLFGESINNERKILKKQ
jgi:hypothetical protein